VQQAARSRRLAILDDPGPGQSRVLLDELPDPVGLTPLHRSRDLDRKRIVLAQRKPGRGSACHLSLSFSTSNLVQHLEFTVIMADSTIAEDHPGGSHTEIYRDHEKSLITVIRMHVRTGKDP
jgi:hypothetical protein